jgi:hypothetical protein
MQTVFVGGYLPSVEEIEAILSFLDAKLAAMETHYTRYS